MSPCLILPTLAAQLDKPKTAYLTIMETTIPPAPQSQMPESAANQAAVETLSETTINVPQTTSVVRSGAHPGARSLPSTRKIDFSARGKTQYLPTLFDRLCDDWPSQNSEAPSEYALNHSQMRAILQRDIAFLLNTINAEDWLDREEYPHIASSTVNYGVPPLAGNYLSEKKWANIESTIRRAIIDFEPRLIADSLIVKPLLKDGAHNHYNVLLFEIAGLVNMQPYPMEFTVQSAVDLETSRMNVQ
jgi:type VI secretion system protein ImpF